MELHGHLHTVTYIRGRIDAIDSPDDEHLVARNMQRVGINKYKKKELCVKLDICKDCDKMHGQQNVKFYFPVIEDCGVWLNLKKKITLKVVE